MKTLSIYSSVFFCFLLNECLAQENLYSFITFDTTTFTSEQEARWNRIHTNDSYTSFHFIEMI
jgi:hypothetical protein